MAVKTYNWFSTRYGLAAVAEAISGIPADQTRMDQWEAQILARVMTKAACWFVNGEANRRLVEDMHLRWVPGKSWPGDVGVNALCERLHRQRGGRQGRVRH